MSSSHWGGFSRTVISIAVALAAAPVLAQNTTSAVSGLVTAADGKPVAGATVQILHQESGVATNVSTGPDGRYSARGLRTGGPYTITIAKDGKTDKRSNVFLALAETLSVDAQLGASDVTTVVVTGQGGASERFSSANMGSGTNIGSRDLAAFASIQRNLQDYARLDPRLAQTNKERGEISVAGQNSRFNSITVDGVTISDTFGLEGNNLPTLKQPISIDAIQSVQINVSNYDVTQKAYSGANINAITKSGTNEWKGSVYYVYRDDDLQGRRYRAGSDTYFAPPPLKETTKGFTLGGPLLKDKLFLFGSYEEFSTTRNPADFGPVGDGKVNVAITPAAIAGAIDVAKSAHGFDAGTFDATGSNVQIKDTVLKLDWNATENHRASVRYAKTEQSEPFFPNFTSSQLSLTSSYYSQAKTIESLVGQWFADWTPNFSTELKVSRREYEQLHINNSRLPSVALNFINALPPGVPANTPNSRTLFLGTEQSRHFNQLGTTTDDGYLAGTWVLGNHELKGGVDISKNEIFNAFLQNTLGNYNFRCVNSSTTYSYSAFPNGINCATASAADVELATLENFRRGRPFTYQVQVAAPGKTLADGAADWSITNTGLFLQDTWAVNKRLNLVGGVRVDKTSVPTRPLANAAAAAAVVPGNATTNTRQTGGFGLDNSVTIDGETLVQPRLGFNWNLDTADKRRQQLRGGFGLFQGAAATVWLSNPYSNTGVATQIVGCGGNFAACPPAGGVFSADPDKQPTSFTGSPPAANVDFIESGMGQPSIWKANLAFEAELPFMGLTAGAEWLHTKVKQGLHYKHLNLGTVTRTGPDGREMYYNANGYNTNCWTATGATNAGGAGCGGAVTSKSLSNARFANVLLASATGKGGGDAITLSLSQRPSASFSWNAAYTRSTAKEVSPLTSSVSNSNFNGRSVFQPNEEVASNSDYLIKDRVSASMSWSKAFVGNYRTSLGVFYEGRTGHTYSWTFNNDINGDGVAGNDLMYIPSAPGSGEVVFAGGAADEARFWDTVYRNPELSRSAGKVVKRNGSFSPFVNSFDVRVSQEVPGFTSKQKGVISLDILNFGNMLDKRWGRTNETLFQPAGGYARSFVNYKGVDANGKYIYSTMPAVEPLETRQARGESQWAVQVTLRYEF